MEASVDLSKAIVKPEFSDLTAGAKVEQALKIADNFLQTIENRIAVSGVNELVANIARDQATSRVEIMLTHIRFDLLSRMETAVGSMDLTKINGVRTEEDFNKTVGEKVATKQFAMNFTPEAQPSAELQQARKSMRSYSFNLACRVAQQLLNKHPELKDYVENQKSHDMYGAIDKYRRAHKNSPDYLEGMVEICIMIRQMKSYDEAYPYYKRFIGKINTFRPQFMDQVADEALDEKEKVVLEQILNYGPDLDFGNDTFYKEIRSVYEGKK